MSDIFDFTTRLKIHQSTGTITSGADAEASAAHEYRTTVGSARAKPDAPKPQESEYLDIGKLLDRQSNSALAQFIALCDQTVDALVQCDHLLRRNEQFASDDAFMEIKLQLAELFMFRSLAEAVGLITLTCYEAATATLAITDRPDLPSQLTMALRKIRARPFMSFDEASEICDPIREYSAVGPPAGFNELVRLLLGDDDVTETSQTSVRTDESVRRNDGLN